MIINKDFVSFILGNAEGKKNSVYIATVCNGVCMAIMMYSLSVGLEDYAANSAVSLRAVLMFALSLAPRWPARPWPSPPCSIMCSRAWASWS